MALLLIPIHRKLNTIIIQNKAQLASSTWNKILGVLFQITSNWTEILISTALTEYQTYHQDYFDNEWWFLVLECAVFFGGALYLSGYENNLVKRTLRRFT